MRIFAIGLFVKDMETMVSFYRDIMKMECNWNGEPNADLEAGGVRLIMYGRDDFEKMTSQSYSYPKGLNGTMELAFDFPDFLNVDKEFKRLIQSGVTPVLPPADEPWGQRTAFVSDPEGNLIEISSFGKKD